MPVIHESTTYRLANMLVEQGFAERRREDGALALTGKIRRIANGVRGDDLLLGRVGPHLAALTAEISWPSGFALLAGGSVTIQDSTHGLSPITFHRATIQQERSLFDTALGRAIMAVLTPPELDAALDIAVAIDGPDQGRERVDGSCATRSPNIGASAMRGRPARSTRTSRPSRAASAAVTGLVGSVNIVFFRRVLSPVTAAERYQPALVRCVEAIAAEA